MTSSLAEPAKGPAALMVYTTKRHVGSDLPRAFRTAYLWLIYAADSKPGGSPVCAEGTREVGIEVSHYEPGHRRTAGGG